MTCGIWTDELEGEGCMEWCHAATARSILAMEPLSDSIGSAEPRNLCISDSDVVIPTEERVMGAVMAGNVKEAYVEKNNCRGVE